jgi:hypothetical protein
MGFFYVGERDIKTVTEQRGEVQDALNASRGFQKIPIPHLDV